jgi:cytochrome c biogenesis protein CcmG, thiol:disulfide interchange protein DsbE
LRSRVIARANQVSQAKKPRISRFRFQARGTWPTLHGKVVVLNFWASWCAPCLEETESLNRLQQEISSRGGVVLGVSVDEDKSAYEKFIADNHVVFPTSLDSTKKSALDYGTSMYPETYLIDRNGRLARKIVGPQDWQSPENMGSIEILLDQN